MSSYFRRARVPDKEAQGRMVADLVIQYAQFGVVPAMARRFLIAREWNWENAIKMLEAHLVWRRDSEEANAKRTPAVEEILQSLGVAAVEAEGDEVLDIGVGDDLRPRARLLLGQRREPEPRTSGLQRWNDLRHLCSQSPCRRTPAQLRAAGGGGPT